MKNPELERAKARRAETRHAIRLIREACQAGGHRSSLAPRSVNVP